MRVLTEAERPLGARTVVVQLLKTAKMRMAPNVERRMVRIRIFLGFSLYSHLKGWVRVSLDGNVIFLQNARPERAG